MYHEIKWFIKSKKENQRKNKYIYFNNNYKLNSNNNCFLF